VQAEAAAGGLALARVKEADAMASEKQGMVEARVTFEKMQSVALGEEKQGLARVKVKEADADAIEKQGKAEAVVVREKLVAEATGLAEKAASMRALDDAGRGHEEFRLKLDKEKVVELETIRNRKDIAASQAQILAEAFGNAKINIVGGDGQFFDRFIKAVSVGQSIDAVSESDTVRSLLRDVVGHNGDAGPISLATVIDRLMAGADEKSRTKLQALMLRSKELGVDQLPSR
jgi:hypothetical protein